MMIDFGPNADILIRRIWIEELPDLRYPVEDVVERTLEAHPKQFGPMRSAAAEMLPVLATSTMKRSFLRSISIT